MDHLVADGASTGILLHELALAYAAFAARRPPLLPLVAVQYADFAIWQRRWITASRLEQETEYWRRKLNAAPLGPGIAFDRQPGAPERDVRVRRLDLSDATYRSLVRLAHGSAMSLFPICVAAVQALIADHSGRSDVVVSTMLRGRHRRGLERVVGLFAGVVRLRTDPSGDPSFRILLGRVRSTLLEALEHQNVPFGRVREALVAEDIPGGAAFRDSSGQAQNLPVGVQHFPSTWEAWRPGSVLMARHGGRHHGTCDQYYVRGQRHPLMVGFFDDRRAMWATLSYKSSCYDDATVDRLADELQSLLVGVAGHPEEPLSRIPRR